MATVYRIECPDCGNGPYTCECQREWRDENTKAYHYSDHYLNARPGMLCDASRPVLEKIYGKWFHGFATIERLIWWFQDDLSGLAKAGFQLAIYQADEWLLSDSRKQVFYNPKSALLDGYKDIPHATLA